MVVLAIPSARPVVPGLEVLEVGVLGDRATFVGNVFLGEAGGEVLRTGEGDAGEADALGVLCGRAFTAGCDAGRGSVRCARACVLAGSGLLDCIPGRAGSPSNPPRTPSPSAISQAASSATPVTAAARTRR